MTLPFLYLLLSTPPQLDKPKQILTWEQSLSFSSMLKQWQQAQALPLIYLHCITHWDSLQKLIYHWYFTPQKLASVYPNHSSMCLRQCGTFRITPTYLVAMSYRPTILGPTISTNIHSDQNKHSY